MNIAELWGRLLKPLGGPVPSVAIQELLYGIPLHILIKKKREEWPPVLKYLPLIAPLFVSFPTIYSAIKMRQLSRASNQPISFLELLFYGPKQLKRDIENARFGDVSRIIRDIKNVSDQIPVRSVSDVLVR